MLVDNILVNCSKHPDKVVFHNRENTYTYGEMQQGIEKYDAILKDVKLFENEPIGLVFDNEPEFVYWLLTMFKNQNPAALIPVYFRKSEIDYHVKCLNLRYAIVQNKYVEKFEKMVVVEKYDTFSLLRNDNCEEFKKICSAEDRIIQFTSGSQGESKAVARTENAISNEVKSLETLFQPVTDESVFMPLSPLFHSYGLIGGTLFPLSHGLTIAFADVRYPKKILSSVKDLKVTHMFVTPFIYKMFCEVLTVNNDSFDFSSIKKSFSAGGALELDVAKRYKELSGVDIFQNYGSTEAGTMALGKEPFYIDNSLGVLLSNPSYSILPLDYIDEENCGELLLKNDSIDFHYLYPESLNQDKFIDGMFRTGDIVQSKNGSFYYKGRSDGLINVNGLKVYASEIESIMLRMDEISEVCVISDKDAKDGAMIAYIVLEKNASVTENDIKQFCKKYMADYKIPRTIRFIDEMPKNSSGKRLKKYLNNHNEE